MLLMHLVKTQRMLKKMTDYDQPAAITINNKELNSNEGEGHPVLFDDPTYQVPSAPVYSSLLQVEG